MSSIFLALRQVDVAQWYRSLHSGGPWIESVKTRYNSLKFLESFISF